jgi:hypothetical protein
MCRYRPDLLAALVHDTVEVPDPPTDCHPEADDVVRTDVAELLGT